MLSAEQAQDGVKVLVWIQRGDKMGEEGQASVGRDVGRGIDKHADYLRNNLFRCCRRRRSLTGGGLVGVVREKGAVPRLHGENKISKCACKCVCVYVCVCLCLSIRLHVAIQFECMQ